MAATDRLTKKASWIASGLPATAKNVYFPIDAVSFFVAGLQFKQLFQSLGPEQVANKIDTGVASFVDGKNTERHLSLKNDSMLVVDVDRIFSFRRGFVIWEWQRNLWRGIPWWWHDVMQNQNPKPAAVISGCDVKISVACGSPCTVLGSWPLYWTIHFPEMKDYCQYLFS